MTTLTPIDRAIVLIQARADGHRKKAQMSAEIGGAESARFWDARALECEMIVNMLERTTGTPPAKP